MLWNALMRSMPVQSSLTIIAYCFDYATIGLQ
jgi:hypothetical protein